MNQLFLSSIEDNVVFVRNWILYIQYVSAEVENRFCQQD